MLHMELSKIIITETSEEQIVVLREVGGTRAFPIVIGIWEALSIDRNIKEKKTPRPMTHDLIDSVIKKLDAKLDRIIINDLKDRTFYATLVLRMNGKKVEIDSRPSDAIALAVLSKAPIYVEERVIKNLSTEAQQAAAPPEFDPESESQKDEPEDEEGSDFV